MDRGKLRASLKDPLLKARELLNLSINQVQVMGLLTRHCQIKGHLHKLGLVNSPECNRYKQASEMASCVLCDCDASATFGFRLLGQHFMKPTDLEEVSVSWILHIVQSAALLNAQTQGCTKDEVRLMWTGQCCARPTCILFFSLPHQFVHAQGNIMFHGTALASGTLRFNNRRNRRHFLLIWIEM